MIEPNVAWASIIGLGFAYEAYALLSKRQGDTLSERTREWFHTRTKTGKAVFSIAWISFAAWFLIHIINGG